MLYGRLDGLREQTSARLTEVLRRAGGSHQARSERDAASARYSEQLARFGAAEHGLCFGRLDLTDGERRYIGRIGIVDELAEYEPLLIDWRAQAASPFYLATAAAPEVSGAAGTSRPATGPWSASTTKCSTSPPPTRPDRTGWPARRHCWRRCAPTGPA